MNTKEPKNPSLKDPQMTIADIEEIGFYCPRPKTNEMVEKMIKNLKKDSVMVIDLDTLQLRPPKYD
jgi:hypothetical protein